MLCCGSLGSQAAHPRGNGCIRGMRLTVRRVVEDVVMYPNRDDLFRNYPELEPDDVRQALPFAAANLEDSAAKSEPPAPLGDHWW